MFKKLVWHRSSLEDLKGFPRKVQRQVGFALHEAQCGDKHPDAKPLKGFGGVMEVAGRFDTNTYRAVYYTKIADRIVVLHCFQKKSKHGIATPKQEIDLIRQRLKEAEKEVSHD
jgi:phage-related protein